MRLLLVILFVFLFGTTSYANDKKKEFISMVEGCIEGIDHPVHIPNKLINVFISLIAFKLLESINKLWHRNFIFSFTLKSSS